MEISSTQTGTSGAATAATQPTRTTSAISTDFDTFLQMLTAQARYQDPLEPIDSTEYASQLAQFSGVEQQVQTNDLLVAMIDSLGASNLSEFAGWIGMEARSTAPTNFDGNPVTISPQPPVGAEEMDLIIYDASQNEVGRIALPVSSEPYVWNGENGYNGTVDPGVYSFVLESRAGGEITDQSSAQSYTQIVEARSENGRSILITASGSSLSPEEITALR